MPGRLILARDAAEVGRFLGAGEMPPLTPRYNIAPGQEVLTLTPEGPVMARWGIIPVGRVNARGRPVMETIVNARSETVFDKTAFDGVARAIVPAEGWYEWTGKRGRKQPWRITRKDGGLMAFAAIYDVWRAPGGAALGQVATVTCAPNAEVREIHHRMGAILPAGALQTWFTAPPDQAAALLGPLPKGQLRIGKADDVDWDGP